jgi:hypothetical protein
LLVDTGTDVLRFDRPIVVDDVLARLWIGAVLSATVIAFDKAARMRGGAWVLGSLHAGAALVVWSGAELPIGPIGL